jgi:P-type E1-E2 ATPase
MVYYNTCMIELTIPGRGTVQLDHLVCDVNGTLALDGKLIEGVARALGALRDRLEIHLVTADTHGRQSIIDQQLGVQAVRLVPGDEAGQKAAFVRQLGAERVVAIGQGANDAGMLSAAAIGIALISPEGLAVAALQAADLLAGDILSALELLEKPLRLVATLRK